MDIESWRWWVIVLLILANAFFVAAEYSLVGARKTRLDSLAKKGNKRALLVSKALTSLPKYIAGIQVAITMAGIGLGVFGESTLALAFQPFFEGVGLRVASSIVAFLLVTYLLVILGELIPKYLTIRDSERTALLLIYPLNLFLFILRPFTFLLETSGFLLLKPFGIDIRSESKPIIAREELEAILKESGEIGMFEESHAKMLAKALRFPDLKAHDVMIPRVDIQFINVETKREELVKKLANIVHTRIVVSEGGDVDEVLGILHLQDVFRLLTDEKLHLRDVIRPATFVPPNLSIEKLIERMRQEKTQLLIVRDEHGGTEGLLTIEDIIEEIFGELDDQIESAQPSIERRSSERISLRGDVRTDELIEFLGMDENPFEREAVSNVLLKMLGRTPKLGDVVETPVGKMRIDGMARNRITRVSLLFNNKS